MIEHGFHTVCWLHKLTAVSCCGGDLLTFGLLTCDGLIGANRRFMEVLCPLLLCLYLIVR